MQTQAVYTSMMHNKMSVIKPNRVLSAAQSQRLIGACVCIAICIVDTFPCGYRHPHRSLTYVCN